jgi:hypothetical protein
MNRLLIIPEANLPAMLSAIFKQFPRNPLLIHSMDDIVDRFNYKYGLNTDGAFEVTESDLTTFAHIYNKAII